MMRVELLSEEMHRFGQFYHAYSHRLLMGYGLFYLTEKATEKCNLRFLVYTMAIKDIMVEHILGILLSVHLIKTCYQLQAINYVV